MATTNPYSMYPAMSSAVSSANTSPLFGPSSMMNFNPVSRSMGNSFGTGAMMTEQQQQQHHFQHQHQQQMELESYLSEKGVQQLLVKIVEKLLVERPDNPIEYIVTYLTEVYPEHLGKNYHYHHQPAQQQQQQLKHTPTHSNINQQPHQLYSSIPFLRGSENNEMDESMLSEDDASFLAGSPVKAAKLRTPGPNSATKTLRPPGHFREQRRGSVSAAPLSEEEKSIPRTVFPKSREDVEHLKKVLPKYWVTSTLDIEQTESLIAAMESVRFNEGEVIIQQGDERADHYYVVRKGSCKIMDKGMVIRQAQEDEGFGELALLYNRPRSATVVAETDCELWRLDRTTFRIIVATSATERRNKYIDFLIHIPLLSSLDDRGRQALADTLQRRQYSGGEVVVKQGDKGSEFFIIMTGIAEVVHDGETVDSLKQGDYFGEIALVDPSGLRAATVRAAPEGLTVLLFRREVFTRILGPYLIDSMRKRIPSYKRTPTKKKQPMVEESEKNTSGTFTEGAMMGGKQQQTRKPKKMQGQL